MAQKLLASPSVPGLSINDSLVTNNDSTNFVLVLPTFLAGIVSAGLSADTVATAEVIVEVEGYTNAWTPLFLLNPEKPPFLVAPMNDSANDGGTQVLTGPRSLGSARTFSFGRVRMRRIDITGGICNAMCNFREGGY